MTVTVSGAVADITGRRDSRAWKVWSPTYRDGDGITVSSREQTVHITNGVFTAEMEPGEAVIESPDGVKWNVLVPDGAVTLRELLASVLPTSDSQQALIDAVAAYLDERGHSVIPDTFGLGWVSVSTGYAAGVGEMVDADATSGGFTVYLPTAPTDRATVWVKKTDTSSNAITVQRTGDDVFNREDGPSSLMLYTPGESVALQYDSGVWYVVNHSLTVTGLDGRYLVKDVSPTAPEVIRILDAYSNISFEMRPTANAVNMLRIYNSATGSYPTIVAGGQDATIGLNLRTTGWGGINLLDGGGGTIAAFYRMASSANVNSWEFKNSTTGEGVVAGAAGSDTNISINMKPKNAGRLQVNGVAVPTISSTDTITNKTFSTPKIDAIHDVTRGLPAAEFYAPTSAVNWTLVKGSAAGQPVALFAQGSDSDVSIQFAPKGAGEVSIYVGTGQTPTLRAVGADTNHDLKLYAKNAGVIKMGSTVGLSGGSGTATIRAGTGSPEGSVTATPGSQYFNTNGGAGATFFVKESGSGNTGWVAK